MKTSELLQGSYNVKNILLNIHITKISLFLECLQKYSQVHRMRDDQPLKYAPVISFRINASYLELYLKMSSFDNISQVSQM